MKRLIITPEEIPSTVETLDKGKFFGLVFRKKDGSLRTARAQLGVHNPQHAARPNGTGESAAAALDAGRLKFFDSTVKNPDGSQGNYRQARFDAIIAMTINRRMYIVDHTKDATIL